jgi:hypothetical protein
VVGTLVRIDYSSAIILVGEAVVAIVSQLTLDAFRFVVGITSVVVLMAAFLAWLSGSGPNPVFASLGAGSFSSGTKPLWDASRPIAPMSPGTLPVAFGTGLVLGGAVLLLRLIP